MCSLCQNIDKPSRTDYEGLSVALTQGAHVPAIVLPDRRWQLLALFSPATRPFCGVWLKPCRLCRYWSDPKVLGKLSAAMGDTFDPTAMAAAHGAAQGEQEDDEEELDVHGAASAGKLPSLS